MQWRPIVAVVAGGVSFAALVVAACTGEDPAAPPFGLGALEAGSANPPGTGTGSSPTPPSDSGSGDSGPTDAGADAKVVPVPLRCSLELSPPVLVTETTDGGRLESDRIYLISAAPDEARVMSREQPLGEWAIWTQNFKNSPPPKASRNSLNLGSGGFLLGVTPMTSGGGTNVTGYAFAATNNFRQIIALEISNDAVPGDGGALGTPQVLATDPLDGGELSETHIVEIGPHQYFYVLSYQPTPSSPYYYFACGTGGAQGPAGPKNFATFSTRPSSDSNLLLHGSPNGTYYVQGGDFSGNAIKTTSYALPDDCVSVPAQAPATTLANPDGGGNPLIIGAARSPSGGNVFDFFFASLANQEQDIGFVGGQATTSDLVGGNTLTIGPPKFVAGPSFTSAASPFSNRAGGAIFDDNLAMAGVGFDPDAGGVNFMITDVAGDVRANATGASAFALSQGGSIQNIAIATAIAFGASVTFYIAWIETSSDGGVHDALYMNRVACIPP
jgi:hypothetical protein